MGYSLIDGDVGNQGSIQEHGAGRGQTPSTSKEDRDPKGTFGQSVWSS